jgi:hypothetical protein
MRPGAGGGYEVGGPDTVRGGRATCGDSANRLNAATALPRAVLV